MIMIQHRVNTLDQLKELHDQHPDYGVEIDIRSDGAHLFLEHDSFWNHSPIELETYLQEYQQMGPLIANLKCEGVEEACLELFEKHSVSNFFFLDMSMPYFVQYSNRAEMKDGLTPENLAVRLSEYEVKEYAINFKNKARWIWLDCFSPKLHLTQDLYDEIVSHGFQLCLVSPELQGHGLKVIDEFKSDLSKLGIKADAVCTKRPDLWQ